MTEPKPELFIDNKFSNPIENVTEFYKGIFKDPATTLGHVFRGVAEAYRRDDVSAMTKVVAPIEIALGIGTVLHGLTMLNPLEIGVGALELGDGFGRYMQLGRELEKGPPVSP